MMNKQLKKTCLTDQIKKYQKNTEHKSGETQKETSEKDEFIVKRRPRKPVQKIRPKSEVRESRGKEVWIDGDRRRPLSYIEGTKEQNTYIQTRKKPVNIQTLNIYSL